MFATVSTDIPSYEAIHGRMPLQSIIRQCGAALAGVINTHSSDGDLRCRAQQNVTFWEGVIDKTGLEIVNDGRFTQYWTREDHEGKSVIDLTLANRPIQQWTILVDDHATGSDDKVMEWKVDPDGQEEADHRRVVVRSSAAMMEKDLEAAEKLWMELVKERADLDGECTEDEVEQEAACIQEAMSSFLNATAKKIRICTKLKRWWNADLKERRNAFGNERRRRNLQEAPRAKGKPQMSIRQSKSEMWCNYLQNLRVAELWRAA